MISNQDTHILFRTIVPSAKRLDNKTGAMHVRKKETFRFALMFKAKGAYGRDIIAGICDYVRSTRMVWDLLLYEDFRSRPQSILDWSGDGRHCRL